MKITIELVTKPFETSFYAVCHDGITVRCFSFIEGATDIYSKELNYNKAMELAQALKSGAVEKREIVAEL
jgi:hypothetical protein